MNCWHCHTELIWGGDHDAENEEFAIVTNLHCPQCDALVFVYGGSRDLERETQTPEPDS